MGGWPTGQLSECLRTKYWMRSVEECRTGAPREPFTTASRALPSPPPSPAHRHASRRAKHQPQRVGSEPGGRRNILFDAVVQLDAPLRTRHESWRCPFRSSSHSRGRRLPTCSMTIASPPIGVAHAVGYSAVTLVPVDFFSSSGSSQAALHLIPIVIMATIIPARDSYDDAFITALVQPPRRIVPRHSGSCSSGIRILQGKL